MGLSGKTGFAKRRDVQRILFQIVIVSKVEEYDGETQGAIRKIMFDQEQKRKGLPTSDELKNEDMLRKAWDAEGSPFKGTPFDPSMINFNGSGDGGGAMPPGREGLPGGLPPLPGAAAEEDEEPRIQEVDG